MVREYIGARYVPKFMGAHDVTQTYEALCVVDNGSGTSYISKIPTPAGTPLTNTTYWAVYGASSGAIVNLQNQIDEIKSETVIGFNTHADMVAADLADDSYAMTLGYNRAGDFGGTIYKISSSAPTSPYPYEVMDNGLYAIPYELYYPEQLGAVHDGTTDVLAIFNTFIANGIDIHLAPKCNYKISDEIVLSAGVNFFGNNAYLTSASGKFFKLNGGFQKSIIENLTLFGGSTGLYAITITRPHSVIRNIKYEGDSHFINLGGTGSNAAYDTRIEKCHYTHDPSTVPNAARYGVYIDIDGGLVNIVDSSFSVVTVGINIVKGANVNISKCNISNGNVTIFPSQSTCMGVRVIEGRNINVENNYIEDFETAVFVNDANAESINIINNFINLLTIGEYVIWLQAGKNIRVNGNYLISTYSGSYGIHITAASRYIIAEGNVFVTTNKYDIGVYTEIVESGSSNDVEFSSNIVNIKRHKITSLASANETISEGGYYDSPTVTFNGTQNLTIDIPTLHVVKFIAHTSMTVNITTASGDTYTKALTRLGDCEVTIYKHDNGLYSIS